jgi:hypothetical protein
VVGNQQQYMGQSFLTLEKQVTFRQTKRTRIKVIINQMSLLDTVPEIQAEVIKKYNRHSSRRKVVLQVYMVLIFNSPIVNHKLKTINRNKTLKIYTELRVVQIH